MRTWLRQLTKVRDTPEALARGLAVGFFFGVSLLWGLQIVLAVVVSHLLRGNKLVAAAATAVSNPLTSVPLYGFCWLVGHLIVGGEGAIPDLSAIRGLKDLLALGPRFLAALLTGTTLVGLVGAAAVYLCSGRLLGALRRWRADRTHREDGSVPRLVPSPPWGKDSRSCLEGTSDR